MKPLRPPSAKLSAAAAIGIGVSAVYCALQMETSVVAFVLLKVKDTPALRSACGESRGSLLRRHTPSVTKASSRAQSRSTMASRWQCSKAPFGMRCIIFQSLLLSMRFFARLNIIPGNTSTFSLTRLSSNSLVHSVCCSSNRIWSTMEQASAAIGDRFSRKTRSEAVRLCYNTYSSALVKPTASPFLLFLYQSISACEILLDERVAKLGHALSLCPLLVGHCIFVSHILAIPVRIGCKED